MRCVSKFNIGIVLVLATHPKTLRDPRVLIPITPRLPTHPPCWMNDSRTQFRSVHPCPLRHPWQTTARPCGASEMRRIRGMQAYGELGQTPHTARDNCAPAAPASLPIPRSLACAPQLNCIFVAQQRNGRYAHGVYYGQLSLLEQSATADFH